MKRASIHGDFTPSGTAMRLVSILAELARSATETALVPIVLASRGARPR